MTGRAFEKPWPTEANFSWLSRTAVATSDAGPEAVGNRVRGDGSTDHALDDLLRAVATGDGAAFGDLYGRTVHPVMALVRLLMRDVALAEEVTQDVFLAVWLGAGRFDPARGEAKAWIMAIARSRAIDRIRSTQATRLRDDKFANETGLGPPTPEDEFQIDLDQHRLHQAMAVLTSLQRQAILLAFFGGHSYSETAGLLGVPLPTVKSRIREGLIRLRRHLDPDEAAHDTPPRYS